MLHNDLINLALSIHSSVLVASIVAYYKYGDRTELIDRGLRGSDAVLTEMRRRIASELIDLLDEYFQASRTTPTVTAEDDLTYAERPTNPVRSEAFRETIRDYVEGHSEVIAHYRMLLSARNSWCSWARFLSWSLLVLIEVEIVIVGALAFVDKLSAWEFPDWSIQWSWLPVALLVGTCVLPLAFMLRKHDIMTKFKIQYEVF